MSLTPPIDPARHGITDREALQWAVQAGLCAARSSLVACQGGLVNQVWRVCDPSGRTFILKRAADHLASAPDVVLDRDRQRVEALALERVWPLLAPELAVPAKLAYDPAQGMLAMQDMGQAPALDVWLGRSGEDQAVALGRALGQALGRLHARSACSPAWALDMAQPSIQRTRAAIQYDALASWSGRHGVALSASLIQRASALGQRLLEPGVALIMGDLWPPSILVAATPALIDWEFAHWGRPEQDLGHLIAHLALARALGARQAPKLGCALLERWADSAREHGLDPRIAHEAMRWGVTHASCEVLIRVLGPFAAPAPAPALLALARAAARWPLDEQLTLIDLVAT